MVKLSRFQNRVPAIEPGTGNTEVIKIYEKFEDSLEDDDKESALSYFLTFGGFTHQKERTKKVYSLVKPDFDEVFEQKMKELDNNEEIVLQEILSFLPDDVEDEKMRNQVITTFYQGLTPEEKKALKDTLV